MLVGKMINMLSSKIVTSDNIEKNKLVTFLNPYSYLIARKKIETFRKIDKIFIDGISLVLLLRIFRVKKTKRASFDMTSFAPKVFNYAIEKNISVYIIGTQKGVIDKAISNIKRKYTKLDIVGFRNGYFFDEKERKEVINGIVKIDPGIVFVGMGTPLQDKFLVCLRNAGWNGTGYTCGGFLHQAAKKLYYFPNWSNKYNIRWIYRIYDEPKLVYRYFVLYPKFLLLFIYDVFCNKFNNNKN